LVEGIKKMNTELSAARLAVLEEISYKREQELDAIREFALYERQALAAAASSPSSSSSSSSTKKEAESCAGDEGKGNAAEAATAAARSDALELQRLRIEMAQIKGERDMLKSHYQQEIMTSIDACNVSRRKQLMAEAAFVIGILDVQGM